MTQVVFLRVWPRSAATGAEVAVRLAGGGAASAFVLSGEHYRAGLISRPTFSAALSFDDNGWAGGTVPASAALGFAPADTALRDQLLGYSWRGARIEIDAGEDGTALARLLTGTVADMRFKDGVFTISVADLSKGYDKRILGASFTGAGGIEGFAGAAGRAKRRSWGQVFNVEGRLLDPVNNIYEFGDPAYPLQNWVALRDKGRDGTTSTVAWAGSIAATLTALQASVPAQGGGVVAPSIACAKWWTQPSGPLTADLLGEIGVGYVETAPAIASRLVVLAGGAAISNLAAAVGWRGGVAGLHIDEEAETYAAAIDRLLLGVSLLWVLSPAGSVEIRQWSFSAPAESLQALFIERERTLPPCASRSVRYKINERVHSEAEISAAVLASDVDFAGGGSVAALVDPTKLTINEKRTSLIPWNAEVTARDAALVGSAAALGLTGASENRLLYSEQLDNAGWDDKVGCTVTANDRTESSVVLDKLVFSGASGQRLGQITNVTNAPNGQYELSFSLFSLVARDVVLGLTDGGTGGTGGTQTISLAPSALTRVATLKSYTANASIDRRVSLSIIGDPSSENRALYSEQFENWSHVIGCTVTANDRSEGGFVLDKLVFTATGATRIGQFSNATDLPNAAYDDALLVYSTSAITVTLHMYDGGTGGTGGSQSFSVPANTLTSITTPKSYTATSGVDRRYWVTVAGEVGTIWASKAHLRRTSFGSAYVATTTAVVSNAGGGGTIWASKAHLRRTSVSSAYLSTTSAIAIVAGDAALIALDGGRGGYSGWRDGLSPAWNDTSADTNIVRATKEAVQSGYTAAMDGVDARIAEVASVATPRHEPASAVRGFTASYLGVLDDLQLPATININRLRGAADVSTTSTWSIFSQSGITGGTVTVVNGVVTIPTGATIAASSSVVVRSVRDGVTVESVISITRSDAPSPSTGGGGSGTSVNDSTFINVTTTSFAAISDLMTVMTGSAGQIAFSAPLASIVASASPDGAFPVELQWGRRPVGGSFTYSTAALNAFEAESFYDAELNYYFNSNGSVTSNPVVTGLSANTNYEVQLFARRTIASPSKTVGFSGTASATGS